MKHRWIWWALSATVLTGSLFIAAAVWRVADAPLTALREVVDLGYILPESEHTVRFDIKNRSLQTAYLIGLKER